MTPPRPSRNSCSLRPECQRKSPKRQVWRGTFGKPGGRILSPSRPAPDRRFRLPDGTCFMEHRTELLRLLSSLCDEQLTEAEQSRLEELLAAEESRRLYLQYVDMHARLLTHPAVAGDSTLPG